METIEYRTDDKAGWGDGPWQSEPDKRQWQDDATGLPCLIVRGPVGALCGYVGVPEGHPAYGLSYDGTPDKEHRAIQKQFIKRVPFFNKLMAGGADFAAAAEKMSEGALERSEPGPAGKRITEIDVHGGLTYAGACSGNICHVPGDGEPDNVWWFGFDCAHCMDLCPQMEMTRREMNRRMPPPPEMAALFVRAREGDVYRDIAYVTAECASLAQQLVAIGAVPITTEDERRANVHT